MPIPGYEDYQRREFCKAIQCVIQRQLDRCTPGSREYEEIRGICQTECIHTTYEFHHWLIEHGYEVVRPKKPAGKKG
jgi:endonuclease III